MNKQYGWFELKDGTQVEGVRITFATKVAFEKAARANGWEAEKQPFTVSAFWAWHAARLVGKTSLSWAEFQAQVIDAGADEDAPVTDEDLGAPVEDSTGYEATGVPPTQPEASTGSPSPSESVQEPALTGGSETQTF